MGVLVLLAGVTTAVLPAGDPPVSLPDTTPQALVTALRASSGTGFSGTVVSRFSLGVPADDHDADDAGPDASLLSLLDGSHTLQVWYGGVDQQRVAVLGADDETDLFRDGHDLWQWDSARRVAVHRQLPAGPAPLLSSAVARAADALSLTPSGLAASALAALDAATRVELRPGTVVADRPAYDLVLTPPAASTRVGAVHIAVDGATQIPLAVQVYARGAAEPAVDVGFTSIRLARPSAAYFHFAPPAGATVSRGAPASGSPVTVLGSGWASVLTASSDHALAPALRRAMSPVSGAWGKGRVLLTDLVSVLLTDDRRLFVGAVDPDALYSAAGKG